MAFSYSSFLIYLAYCRFGYQTYKSISSPVTDIDSPHGLKRRKLLLKWVCSTLILWFVYLSDYILGFLPTYYFWRGILYPLMIFDGTLATKIMTNFENHIENVEKWCDKVVHAVCSVYNLVYFPTFIFLIEKLDFVVTGATKEQLDIIEKLIKTFRINVRKIKKPIVIKKPEVIQVKEKPTGRESVPVREVPTPKRRVPTLPTGSIRNSMAFSSTSEVKTSKTPRSKD